MADQADLVGFKTLRLASSAIASAPTDGAAGTPPALTMSPTARAGYPTAGLAFMLKAPSASSATAGAGGFTIVPWMRDPVSLRWGSMSSVSVAYGELWSSWDFDPCELFFQITNVAVAGDLDLLYAEQ